MSSDGARYAHYLPPDTSGVDCDAMRTIEAHAAHLEGLMGSQLRLLPEHIGCQPDDAEYEWIQTRQWLSMVAGLNFVNVTPNRYNYWGLCERADAYDGAKNDVVSDVATEETRLLYAWGATERLLRLLRLPDVPDKGANSKLYNKASLLISTAFTKPDALEHYSHVVRHLRKHVSVDVGLSEDRSLIAAGQEKSWRNPNAVLLPLGAAMRNVPAHGASEYPEPEDWHIERSDAARRPLHSAAHAPRLACRGLLLSIQQLLSVVSATGDHSYFEAEEFGWPVREGGHWQWIDQPTARQLLVGAHLARPEDPD